MDHSNDELEAAAPILAVVVPCEVLGLLEHAPGSSERTRPSSQEAASGKQAGGDQHATRRAIRRRIGGEASRARTHKSLSSAARKRVMSPSGRIEPRSGSYRPG